MSRGNRRSVLFKEEADYLYFLQLLCMARTKHFFKLHALCLMTNHFHILIGTGNEKLWIIMQKVLSLYAEEFNHKYHLTGHVFEGRYTSCIVKDEGYFLEVSRYIHLNPVKAQMVKTPDEYKYSSYRNYIPVQEINTGQVYQDAASRNITGLILTDRALRAFCDDIIEGVYRVMQGAPKKENGDDGLPIPPYAVYNIGGGTPENLLDYIRTLQEELVSAGVLPADVDEKPESEIF